jgi:glycosyltransferase involved in cell wall biosynthesis
MRLLFLSNMVREKGPLVLLEALSVVKARGLAFEAVFAGSRFDDGCVDELEAGVRRFGLSDQVRYVGPVYGDAKDALFREHDIFVFPTYYPNEAFPLVLLEAMQRGLPVVSTFEGAIPEIVTDGKTGFLVPQRDVGALADRLETLIGDPRRCREMGNAGRARYLEEYTLDRFEENLARVLGYCLSRA